MSQGSGVRFTYRGRVREARPGETILDALAREGLPTLTRSNRYHRPRAPFCNAGACANCLVRVNDRPSARACRNVPSARDRVVPERGWPSPRWDLAGALDFVYPRGMDALHGLRRPAFLTPFYQRMVRRVLGVGTLPPAAPGPYPIAPPQSDSADVLIIGSGESGRPLVAALHRFGAQVLVVDRNYAASPAADVELRAGAAVTFLPAPEPSREYPFTAYGFVEPDRPFVVRARTLVVATGSYDAGLLFGGNDRPGILSAEAALSLGRSGARPLFRRAVLVGGGRRVRQLLDELGERVAAVAAPGEIGPDVARRASELDVPLYPRSLILYVSGRSRVRRVHLRTRGRGSRYSIAADAVVLAHRRLPHSQLLFQAGAAMRWREASAAYFPAVDEVGATTVPGLYAIGSVAGDGPLSDAEVELRGSSILARTPPSEPRAEPGSAVPSEMVGYYRELLAERRRGRWIACVCEDVLLSEVEEAARRGYRGIEVAKRYTGLGTGICQGRYCVPDALLLLSLLEQRAPADVGYITQRPPVFPTPLAALAGWDAPVTADGAP
jgi:sarcosine oxidase, subunit alpha